MKLTDNETAILIESYVRLWLTEGDVGKRLLANLDLEVEPAIDSVVELINGGFLKLQCDGAAFTDITLCIPPSPPSVRVTRPQRH